MFLKLFLLLSIFFSALLLVSARPGPSLQALSSPESVRSNQGWTLPRVFRRRTTTPVLQKRENIPVDVWFHVVRANDTVEGGNIPLDRLAAQWDVLRTQIATLGVDLTLRGTTNTSNSDWHSSPLYNYDMQRALRKGNFRTLNVFFTGGLMGGYTTIFNERQPRNTTEQVIPGIPVPENPNETEQLLDGVFISHKTVPGGSGPGPNPEHDGQGEGWNLGKTAVHEVGHWLSLYHIFEACNYEEERGDWVADTPSSSQPTYHCPGDPRTPDWFYDSCGDDDGLDPHDNPMGYFDDRCKLDYFTPGQAERVQMMWPRTRGKFPVVEW